jgi:hypothetical protein
LKQETILPRRRPKESHQEEAPLLNIATPIRLLHGECDEPVFLHL